MLISQSTIWVRPTVNAVLCFVAQSCPTLCDPMDCRLPGSSVHGHSPGKNSGVGCLALLQRIFPIQGSNPGLPHCRQILYQLNHREALEYWSGWPIPSALDLPNPGINMGSPALQADSLPTELSGKPNMGLLHFLILPLAGTLK